MQPAVAAQHKASPPTQILAQYVARLAFVEPAQHEAPLPLPPASFQISALDEARGSIPSTTMPHIRNDGMSVASIIGLIFSVFVLITAATAIRFRKYLMPANLVKFPVREYTSLAAKAVHTDRQPVPPIEKLPFAVIEADYQSFQLLLEKIQHARGQADLHSMSSLVSPEFMDNTVLELTANTANGLIYKTSQTRLAAAELFNAYEYNGVAHAEIALSWTAIDYMARLDRLSGVTDYVTSGNANHPVNIKELWTFIRSSETERWALAERLPMAQPEMRQKNVA